MRLQAVPCCSPADAVLSLSVLTLASIQVLAAAHLNDEGCVK
jgi:hypothetical protein